MATYKFASKTMTANEKAKAELISHLGWIDLEALVGDEPEVIERMNKHIDRLINTLDTNGNLRNKMWGEA